MKVEISYKKDNGASCREFLRDPLVSIILKIIEATYNNKDTISIENPLNNVTNKNLSSFLTFLINYPHGIHIPKIIIKKAKQVSNSRCSTIVFDNPKTVILFSGGIDSTAAMLYFLEKKIPFFALWCDYGQSYNEPERAAVYSICNKLNIRLIVAKIDLSRLMLLGENTFKHIVPARNFLFAAIAARLGFKDIVLAGLKDELGVPDKSPRMYREGPDYLGCKISSPFVHMTKAEVARVWRRRWQKLLHIRKTVSCYNSGGNCQNCAACAKREVAFLVSGLKKSFPKVFKNQEFLIFNHWLGRLDTLIPERRYEIIISLYPFIKILSPKMQQSLNVFRKKYRRGVHNWKRHVYLLQDVVK